MNVLLYADLQCIGVKQMCATLKEVNFIPYDPNVSSVNQAVDLSYFVISPQQVQDRQIPSCLPTLIDDSNKRPKKTLFTYLQGEQSYFFTQHQVKSLEAIGKMISANGATWLKSLPMTMADWVDATGVSE